MTITIAMLEAVGVSSEQIVKLKGLEEAAELEAQAGRREANRIANRAYRARKTQQKQRPRDRRDDHFHHAPDLFNQINGRVMHDAMTQNPSPPNGFPSYSPSLTTPPLESSLRSDSSPATPVDEDPRAKLFREGGAILVSLGVAEKRLGPLLGRWLKDCGNDEVGLLAIIEYARGQCPANPAAYITASINRRTSNGRGHKPSIVERCNELAARIREQEIARGVHRSCRP
jgi:hypothetical protein